MAKTIAIDFDGVLHDHKHPIPGRRMGKPMEGARDAVRKIKARGDKIVVFTVWGGTELGHKTISDWMRFYDIPFHEITNIKPQAAVYLDDKAVRFVSWAETEV